MKNLCLSLISVIIIPALWFSSCAKSEDNNDNIAPVIKGVRFNSNDTINWEGTIIKINDSTSTNKKEDTLVIGKMLYFSGKFSSNKDNALSGYKVTLIYKARNKKMEKEIDTTLTAVGASIFGKAEADIWRNRLVIIPDSVSRKEKNKAGQDTTTFFHPMEGDYKVKVVCGDIYGNRHSLLFPVRLLSRKSVYDSRK